MSTSTEEFTRSAPETQNGQDAHTSPETSQHGDLERAKERNDEGSSTPQAFEKGRDIQGFRWFVVCISLYITCALYGLDTTIAADVQGSVIESLGHTEQLAWVGAGFPLGSVCVILLLGRLYELFNIKWNFVGTVLLFEIGSAVCGSAPTMNALIVGRVIAGAGGSGIYLGSLQYITVMTGEKERGLYMSLIGAAWGAGAVLGPVIGGAFAVSSATWRWAFYINLVIGAISAPGFILYLPAIHPTQGISVRDGLASIDWAGFVLGTGTWVTFLLALTMAGDQWPWNDGRTIAVFIVFGIVLVLYVLQQYFALLTTTTRRLFPCHLLRSRTQVLLSISTAAGTTILFVVVYYVPIYFQFVNNDAALMAAVRLLPFIVFGVAVNLVSGTCLHLIDIYMILYLVAGSFTIAGGGPLVVYLSPSTSTGVIYGLTILIAVGAGLSMTVSYTVATLTLKPEQAAAGISMQNVAQIGGQVIALAVAGQIYRSVGVRKLGEVLAGEGFSGAEIQGGISGVQDSLFQKLDGELREQAILAITRAMQLTFVMVPTAGAVVLLAGLCMKRDRLFGKPAVVAA